MTFTIDGETYDDEFTYTATSLGLMEMMPGSTQGTVGTVKNDTIESKTGVTFDSKYNLAVEDLIMQNSKFKEWADSKNMRRSPNVDNRIEESLEDKMKPLPPITQDDIDQQNGVFINPAEEVTHPVARDLGANELNRMIIEMESKPAKQRDDIGDLIKDLKRKYPERFPKK